MCLESYKNKDNRAFVFVVHPNHGVMLLHCTRKRRKGFHFQLPGGHVDDFEFEVALERLSSQSAPSLSSSSLSSMASSSSSVPKDDDVLLLASKMAAARELYEETGIDITAQLHRLWPAPLRKAAENMTELELCSLKNRCYFHLSVVDEDFPRQNDYPKAQLTSPLVDGNGCHLKLKISHEHSGFMFESVADSIAKLEMHSGGYGSKAIQMIMRARDSSDTNSNTNVPKSVVTKN